jgi:maleate isomerase
VATLSPDLVAYACTAGTFVDGPDAARSLCTDIERIAGCPVVATSQSMVDALRHLSVTRIALATPYPRDVTEVERRFLVGSGFDVVASACLGRSGADVRPTRFDEITELVRGVDRPTAEAIFVSCTDLRALEVAASLEAALGKPVLTSNQVTLWGILRALNIAPSLSGFGRLLSA